MLHALDKVRHLSFKEVTVVTYNSLHRTNWSYVVTQTYNDCRTVV